MRAIWSGVIGFGLVNIPVRLYSPAKEESIDLDLLHKTDKSPIRYARVCKEEEKEVEWKDIVRGYKEGDRYVVLTPEDFKKADARKTNAIDIVHFAEQGEIDPSYFKKPYYLEPQGKSDRAYLLLREALKRAGKVGIATFVLRNRENLAAIRPSGDVLVLEQLRFPDELQPPGELNLPTGKVASKEMEIAMDIIGRSTEPFRPEAHGNAYLKALHAIIRQKAKGVEPKARGKAPVPTEADDLMDALRRSLRQRPHRRVRQGRYARAGR